MRLTITVCPRRRTVLRIAVDHAVHYPPEYLRRVLVAAADRAVADLNPPRESTDPVPAPRRAPDDQPAATAEDQPGGGWPAPREATRGRVLRILDQGHTVGAAADCFGVDPALIDRWDDDAATDAHTDLLTDGPGHHPDVGGAW